MSVLAEQSLIGCLLLDKESISEVYGRLKAEMFSTEILAQIYVEFLRGYDNRYDVNLVTLQQKLVSDLYSEQTIFEVIRECMGTVATSAEIKSYANTIIAEWKKQKVDELINRQLFSPNSINAQIGELINELEALQDSKSSEVHSLAEIVEKYKGDYFKEREFERVLTGFSRLDETMYLEGGDMTIIGARPAVGKSALAAQIAIYIATKNKRVAVYNLEMLDKQMYERFVVNASGIPLGRLKQAIRFLGDEKQKFDRANELLSKRDNLFISTGSKTVQEIRNECRHMEYDVIIIDYLQLLKSDKSNANRAVEVGYISKALKQMAMELNVPVIVLSQLNRASEGKESKEPTMSELRESGDIEQDASNIILLWNLDEQKHYKGCKLEKNRQGELTRQVLEFDGSLMKFLESDMGFDDVVKNNKSSGTKFSDSPFD